MNAAMRQSVLIAYRTGSDIPKIASALGFTEEQVSKVIHPPSTCRITTAFKSVSIGGRNLAPVKEMTKSLTRKEIQLAAGKKAAITRKTNQLKKLGTTPNNDIYLLISEGLEKIQKAITLLKERG